MQNQYAKSISIYAPGKNNQWVGPYTVKQFYVNNDYISKETFPYDYGALILDGELDMSRHDSDYGERLLLDTNKSHSKVNARINIRGVINGTMYMGPGLITSRDRLELHYSADAGSGQSGAPVLMTDNSRVADLAYPKNVVGIHTSGSRADNYGARMTDTVKSWYDSHIKKAEENNTVKEGTYILAALHSKKIVTVGNKWQESVVYQKSDNFSSSWEDSQHWAIIPQGNKQYKIENTWSKMALDVPKSSLLDEIQIIQFPFKETPNQLWRIHVVGKDAHFNPIVSIINVNSGKALDITNSSLYDYAKLIQFGYKGSNNQKFVLYKF